jgi:putative transposase
LESQATVKQDHKLLLEIKQSYDDSYGIYGSPRIHRDLREAGINCGVKRVARLMHQAKLKSIRGYKRPRYKSGKPSIAAPRNLKQSTV